LIVVPQPANGDVYAINAKPGDVFVLASDGVYDNLSEDAIVSVANEDAQLKLLAGIAKRGLAEVWDLKPPAVTQFTRLSVDC
jgi:serine/threonine protein phosphatase PrpC